MILYKVTTYLQGYDNPKEVREIICDKRLNEIYVIAANETQAIDKCIMECERLDIISKGRQTFFNVLVMACNAEKPFATNILIE
jgi:hypothetical protein